ncbi:MAG: Hsp20/alpha crystallin family protein [Thermomicrobiales bacterium]|nr:Hsp20/alpha crystallin family protein [Thermomicrobiales bacterium]
MSISRWDPWGDIVSLREAMNQLFEESYSRPRGGGGNALGLAVDVQETADSYVIHTSVPGVKQEDVSIALLGSTLTIRGERKEQKCDEKDGRWLIRERQSGAFQRSVTLPGSVNADGAQADFADGVLTITLPKAERDKVRQITVRGAESPNVVEAESSTE